MSKKSLRKNQSRQVKKSKKNTKPRCRNVKRNNYRPKRSKKSTNLNLQHMSEYLNYRKIVENLNKLVQRYPNNIQVEGIGNSKEGRTIFLVFISNDAGKVPKNAVFVEAGSNGEDVIAVASALYIIDYLCKNASTSKTLKIMDCFIIPCTNPDAYEQTLYGQKPKVNIANSFPFKLGQCDLEDIGDKNFLETARKWKENYKFPSPERVILIRAVATYQFAIKLFISLQEEGEKIVYPFGMAKQNLIDVEDLVHVAKIARSESNLNFQIGSIYQQCGLTFGTVIDFLRIFTDSFKFTYIIHMNDRKKRRKFNEVPERAENVLCCITLMAKEVFKFYNVQKEEVSPPKQEKFINKKPDE